MPGMLSPMKSMTVTGCARLLVTGLLVAAVTSSFAAEIKTFGQVNRITSDQTGILVAGVGGTFCFMADSLAGESVAAMSAVLAAAVANELDIQPNTLNSAWMICDESLFIKQIGMCTGGVNPATSIQCF